MEKAGGTRDGEKDVEKHRERERGESRNSNATVLYSPLL